MTTTDAVDVETRVTYSSPEVVELTGASYRQVDYWCRTGRLSETAAGSGSQRKFTADDLTLIALVVRLVDHFSLNESFHIARELMTGGQYAVPLGASLELVIRSVPTTQPPEEATA